MFCKACDKVFKPPQWLASPTGSERIAGCHHDSLAAFRSAAQEGCHVCAIAAAHLSEYPTAGGFRFNFGESADGFLVFRLFRDVEGDGESKNGPRPLTFRLYPFNEGLRSLLLKDAKPEPNTRSQTSWAHALSWMGTCTKSHAACKPNQPDGAFTPTRLLHVSRDPNYIYLCENDEIPRAAKYTTLSHCWGSVALGTLLTTNIGERKRGIKIDSLVKTFQDAVEVTRRLKVEYIWIDCLCIVQDSRQDWQRESLLMGSVYGNSYCDLAATASVDGRGGLFRERDPRVVKPCIVGLDRYGARQYHYLSDFNAWWHDFERSPLNVRAWVLQERLLSPRVLHFARDQLVWECNELQACERYPTGVRAPLPAAESPRIFRIAHEQKTKGKRVRRNQGKQDKRDIFEIWSPVVKAYSGCAITKDTDRLVALHGIASMAQKALGCRYIAGLWERGLEYQLGWKVINPQKSHRPTEYVAPSWSWASVKGEVELFPRGNPKEQEDPAIDRFGNICQVLEIQDSAEEEHEADFISRAVLVVRCFLVPITVVPVSQDDWTDELDEEWRVEREEHGPKHEGDADGETATWKSGVTVWGGDYVEMAGGGKAPWMTLYRFSDGGSVQLLMSSEQDIGDESLLTEPHERWLMPTWYFNPTSRHLGAAVRGLVLKRRADNGGEFQRCGYFECGFGDEETRFWDCCLDFMAGAPDGLEKRRFGLVMSPLGGARVVSCGWRYGVEQPSCLRRIWAHEISFLVVVLSQGEPG